MLKLMGGPLDGEAISFEQVQNGISRIGMSSKTARLRVKDFKADILVSEIDEKFPTHVATYEQDGNVMRHKGTRVRG
jgi:hypothetical protein